MLTDTTYGTNVQIIKQQLSSRFSVNRKPWKFFSLITLKALESGSEKL